MKVVLMTTVILGKGGGGVCVRVCVCFISDTSLLGLCVYGCLWICACMLFGSCFFLNSCACF